ncbi:MAG: hypothetical protein KBS41_04390 [Oscillospiraceae bacterium]|nr:hypothetical protein [Candidatus Equicaccousia limihippi]
MLLQKELSRKGMQSDIISLDDFYGGDAKPPLNSKGEPDFEAVEALDLKKMRECFESFVKCGKTEIPQFDFINHVRSDKVKTIDLPPDGVLIVEGLHALNPAVTDCLPQKNLYKIYVSVSNSIYDSQNKEERLLDSRDMRLIRRLSRDSYYRNSDAVNTLRLWKGVVEGEKKYINEFKKFADMRLSTFHPYEVCVFKKTVENMLKDLPEGTPKYNTAKRIEGVLKQFESIDASLVPDSSLLCEFIEKR